MMDRGRRGNGESGSASRATSADAVPGKTTLTSTLPVQRATPRATHEIASPVQRLSTGDAPAAAPAEIAASGVAGSGSSLPHLSQIQASFGHHDLSGVTAHQGSPTREAAHKLGARAFAFGNAVGFDGPPDLHTAAHEAAHVVQQRGGVQLKGGIDGGAGDPYERHADRVADAVVAGHSAESLLDGGPGSHGHSQATVQRKEEIGPNSGSSGSPADGHDKHSPQAPDLKGAPYQWVSGTFSFWVSSAWLHSDPNFAVSDDKWIVPARARVLLGMLHDNGMLSWVTPERIAKASTLLGIDPGEGPVMLIHLRASAFDSLGLPPGASALVAKTSGRGLDVVLTIGGSPAAEGKEVSLSPPAKQQFVTALEKFTGLTIVPAERQRMLNSDLHVKLGAGTAFFQVDASFGEQLFGKAAYDHWYEGSNDKQAQLSFDAHAGTGAADGGHDGGAGQQTGPAISTGAATKPTDRAAEQVAQSRALFDKLRGAFPDNVDLHRATAWPDFLAFVADHASELKPLLHSSGRPASLDELRKLLEQFEHQQDAEAGDSSGAVNGHADGKAGGGTAGTKDGDIRTTTPDGIKDGSIYGEAGGDKYGWIRWIPQGALQLHPVQPTYVTGSTVQVELAWDLSVHPDAGQVLLPNHCEYVWTVRHNGQLIDTAGRSIFANDRRASLALGKEARVYDIEVTAISTHFNTERHRFSSSTVVHAVSEQAFDAAAFDAAQVAGPNAAFSRDDHGKLHLQPGETARTTAQEIESLDLNTGAITALAKQGKISDDDRDVILKQLGKQREALQEIQDKTKDGTPYVVRGTFVGRDDSSTLSLHLLMHLLRRTESGGVTTYELILHDTTQGEPVQHPGSAKQRLAGRPPAEANSQLEVAALDNMASHFHAHNGYPSGTVHLAAQQLASDAVWEKTLDTNNGTKQAKKVLGTMAAIGGIALMVVPGGGVVSAGLMVISATAGIGSVIIDVRERIAETGKVKVDRQLVMDVLQVVAIALPFGAMTKTLAAASEVGKRSFLLCMTALDTAQAFVIAADVREQLREIDANTSAQLATTSEDQRRQILAERDRQVAETIGGAMVNGTFMLVSLGHGIKNMVAITRRGAAYTVRQPVHELAKWGRADMEQALSTDTFEHQGERVQLTAEERRYLEHEIASGPRKPGEDADNKSAATDGTVAKEAGTTSHAANDATGTHESNASKSNERDPAGPKSDLDKRVKVRPPNHPGVEVHNHLLGIPATKYFVDKVGGGEPRTLFEKIEHLFRDSRHARDLQAESPATQKVVEATRAQLNEMDAAGATKAETDGFLADQLDKILAASDDTPFDQSYSIRDALIKEYIDPTKPGEKQSYKNFTADALKILADDGIKYSEQSVSAKKLTQNMSPDDMAAAHQTAAASGKDSDMRFLAMMDTKTIATEAPVAPPDGAPKDVVETYNKQKAKYDKLMTRYRDTLDMIDKVLQRGDVMGIDIAGPEEGKFTEEGVQRFLEMYEHISGAAKARGRELVLRPHVGEGYAPPGGDDAAHVEVARANLETLLNGLEAMGYNAAKGKEDGVIIRFGHATHATPEQIKRMKQLGIIAEANIGSNLATGSIADLNGHPLLYNLYFDEPTILSTDGHGVMGTNLKTEYATAERLIQEFKAGRSKITIDGVDKRYENPNDPHNSAKDPHFLTDEEKARFDVEKLKSWADEYGDRVKAGDSAEKEHRADDQSQKPGS